MKKILSLILSTILIISLFSACSSSGEKLDIIYPFNGDVDSYDPQVASTQDEFLIAENCYEGLIRVDDDGKIRTGVATSWSVSEDGLTYTFTLRHNAVWFASTKVKEMLGLKDEDVYAPKVTANDFVFALKRAVDPSTECPLYSYVSNISGAGAINSGKTSVNTLGVSAPDDYTLVITLMSPDSKFLTNLAYSAAMPCNEEFFNLTNGRYGLSREYSLFNGQFYVNNELDASYLLKKNTKYIGDNPTKVTDITLNVVNSKATATATTQTTTTNASGVLTTNEETTVKTDNEEDIVAKLESGYYDAAFLTSAEYSSLDKKSEITATPYSDTTWTMLINCNSGSLFEKKFRRALCLAVSEPNLDSKDYYSKATQLVPPSCITTSSKDIDLSTAKNLDVASQLWKEGLQKTGTSNISLTLITTNDKADMAKELVQGIQGSIGKISTYGDGTATSMSLKIETMTKGELTSRVKSGNYDIALYPMTASSNSGASFVNELYSNNLSFFSSKAVTKAINKLNTSSAENQLTALIDAQKKIISTYSVKPVFYEYSYYAMAKNVSGIEFHPGTGRVSFINATRNK